jgi:hypothetical protein
MSLLKRLLSNLQTYIMAQPKLPMDAQTETGEMDVAHTPMLATIHGYKLILEHHNSSQLLTTSWELTAAQNKTPITESTLETTEISSLTHHALEPTQPHKLLLATWKEDMLVQFSPLTHKRLPTSQFVK